MVTESLVNGFFLRAFGFFFEAVVAMESRAFDSGMIELELTEFKWAFLR